MKISEFADLVDLHGDDLSQWPQHLRASAMGLMEKSAEAREIMDGAKQLRNLLTSAAPIRAPMGLADRVIAQARATDLEPAIVSAHQSLVFGRSDYGRALRLALLLACFGVGIALGLLDSVNADAGIVSETSSSIFSDLVR